MTMEQIEVFKKHNIWFLRDADGKWYIRIRKRMDSPDFDWTLLETSGPDVDELRRKSMKSYSPSGRQYTSIVEDWQQSNVKERLAAGGSILASGQMFIQPKSPQI